MESTDSKVYYTVSFQPFDISLKTIAGNSILEAIIESKLPIGTTCGNRGTCGDCVVQVIEGQYKSRKSSALPAYLSEQGYVLACQTIITGDLVVILPSFRQLSIKIITDSEFFDKHRDQISASIEVGSSVQKIDLQVPVPNLQNCLSDYKRVEIELAKKLALSHFDCEYQVLKQLSKAIRQNKGEISLFISQQKNRYNILNVEPQNSKPFYGIACDIGTTTVAVQLVDLQTGKILKTVSGYNQQIQFGEDIISRINYSKSPEKLNQVHSAIVNTINQLLKKALATNKIPEKDIYLISISGNTTMIHLFLNLDPQFIREEPYVPTVTQISGICAGELGIKTNPAARILFSPAVGSYVGGDITAGLLCTPFNLESEKIYLFIDIGTNGELVIGNKDWLVTCACSAGPAFEGNGVKCGMPAAEGAIDKIEIDKEGRINYSVIDEAKPRGICGSGLIDLVAELFVHGYIDRYGKFNFEKSGAFLVESDAGSGFLIVKAEDSFWGRDIFMTESDIANIIRTKAAIFSAYMTLINSIGISLEQVDSFFIAGGFGKCLNLENSIRLGLFPDISREKFHYLGNSSLLGAYLVLISMQNHVLVDSIAKKMTYLDLSTESSYMNEYTGALFLPHTDASLFPSFSQLKP